MRRLYDTLSAWARRTSAFTELLASRPAPVDAAQPMQPGEQIYRLKHWPQLPESQKSADIYRTLSVMSSRPINRRWILSSSRMSATEVDNLLQRLIAQDAVEVIDTARFEPSRP
jgi:hypothetical protein